MERLLRDMVIELDKFKNMLFQKIVGKIEKPDT